MLSFPLTRFPNKMKFSFFSGEGRGAGGGGQCFLKETDGRGKCEIKKENLPFGPNPSLYDQCRITFFFFFLMGV